MDYRTIYDAPRTPEMHHLRPAPYIVIDMAVAAGSLGLWNALQVLERLSDMIKTDHLEDARDDLYPLEGVWEVIDSEALDFEERIQPGKIMMCQPDDLTSAQFEEQKRRLAQTADESQRAYLEAARLVIVDDGVCVHMRHIGPYGDEPASFAILERYLRDHGLRRTSERTHREIYLVDVRTAQPEAYETVLRVQVEAV